MCLRLALNSPSSCLYLPSAGIITSLPSHPAIVSLFCELSACSVCSNGEQNCRKRKVNVFFLAFEMLLRLGGASEPQTRNLWLLPIVILALNLHLALTMCRDRLVSTWEALSHLILQALCELGLTIPTLRTEKVSKVSDISSRVGI